MSITLHYEDLPDDLDLGNIVAIDTEAMGLNPVRDRLCVVQLSAGDGTTHLVHFRDGTFNAPNLVKLLEDPNVLKLFHFGRFDIAIMWAYLGALTAPVYCTKIASRMARTFTQHHGLSALCRDLLGVEMSKKMQTSYWGTDELTPEQQEYAASDVLYLHQLREKLNAMLDKEGRLELAEACFDFLPHRAVLDIAGWSEEDIFAHH